MRTLAFGLCGVLAVSTATAGISPESPTSTYGTSSIAVTYPGASVAKSSSTVRTATVGSSGITVNDAFAVTGGFASIAGVGAQRVLGFPQVGAMAATAVAGCVTSVVCVVGAAALTVGAAAFLEGYRIRGKNKTNRTNDAAASALQTDVGVPAVMVPTDCWKTPGITTCYSSAYSAIFAKCEFTAVQNSGGNYTSTCKSVQNIVVTGAGATGQITLQNYFAGSPSDTTNQNATAALTTTNSQACPSYFDFFLGVVPQGSTPGLDGKCPSGVYTDTDVAGVQALVTARTPAQVQELNKALAAFNDWAAGSTACESCSAPATTLSGPATLTLPATTVTTVSSAGTTVATTTKVQTLSYPVSSPPTLGLPATAYIKIGDNTTVQSVLTPAGGGSPVTTTTTTSTNADALDAAAAAASAAAVTQCDKFPDSAGCARLGTATAVSWEPTNQTITMTPAAPWGSDNGACPTPQSLTLGGFAIPFDNTLMCQFFSGMRFAVLAAASIIAVMIFLGARGGAE